MYSVLKTDKWCALTTTILSAVVVVVVVAVVAVVTDLKKTHEKFKLLKTVLPLN